MKSKKMEHRYLLSLYAKVDEYLSGTDTESLLLPEAIVSFCTIVEKLFKIRLYKKNPILIFDLAKFKDNASAIAALTKGREMNIDTIKISEVLTRYRFVFDRDFSEDEIQILSDLFGARNDLIHGHSDSKEKILDVEDLQKKMGTIWEKISVMALKLFGTDAIKASKPKRKYTREELEKVLLEEVRKKIRKNDHSDFFSDFSSIHTFSDVGFAHEFYGGESCPRCGSFSFSDEATSEAGLYLVGYHSFPPGSDFYRCKSCNLELTKKEYGIAKRIKMGEC